MIQKTYLWNKQAHRFQNQSYGYHRWNKLVGGRRDWEGGNNVYTPLYRIDYWQEPTV